MRRSLIAAAPASVLLLVLPSAASALLLGPAARCRPQRQPLLRRAHVRCRDDGPDNGLADGWEAAGRKDELAEDIARFKAAEAADPTKAAADLDEPSLLDRTIDTLGTVLTYNFFIIIAFFAWFMTGVGLQFGAQQYAVINAFRGAWDLIILPLLTTHMTLTFLSAGLEKLAGRENA